MLNEKRPGKRRAFAVIAMIAGFVLLALELMRPHAATAGERWFWLLVGVLLVGLGLAGVMDRGDPAE